MSFDFIRKLPTPQEIKEKYPVPDDLVALKKNRDEFLNMVDEYTIFKYNGNEIIQINIKRCFQKFKS